MLPSLSAAARTLLDGTLNLLFPGACWACGVSLLQQERLVCSACRQVLTSDPHETCPRCSSSVGPGTAGAGRCPRCRDESFAFDRAMRLGPYQGPLREMVLRLKQRGGEALAEVMGRLWAETAADRLKAVGATVVIPVPLHWRKHLTRGFNQSHALALGLAEVLALPCRARCLRRLRSTPQQAHLSPTARRENVRGAFAARPGLDFRGQTVLLVDDVMTTGSTASEAARALRAAKPTAIVLAILAHGT